MRRRLRSWLSHLPAAALALAGIGLAFSLAASERNPLPTASGARAGANDTGRVIVRYRAGSSLLPWSSADGDTSFNGAPAPTNNLTASRFPSPAAALRAAAPPPRLTFAPRSIASRTKSVD